MVSFAEEDMERLDWQLLRDSSVSVYCDQDTLTQHLRQLIEDGYAVVEFECGELTGAGLAIALSAALGRPITGRGSYLDVLDDIFYDPARLRANIPTPGGLVLVLRGFDSFTTAHEHDAAAVLSILDGHSRAALMLGLRWIVIVQVSDPDFAFVPLQLEIKLNFDEAAARANSLVDWASVLGEP